MADKSGGNPVLIGGDGRSGTTLLAAVLDAHPQLAVGPELHFRGPPNLGPLILRGLELMDAGDERMTSAGVRSKPEFGPPLRFIRRARRFGVEPGDLYELVRQAMNETGSELEDFPTRCRLVECMGYKVASERGKDLWGTKIMREIRAAPHYLDVWPAAAIIHIVRDGRDVAASQVREHSSWGYKTVEEAAAKWSHLVGKASNLADDGIIHEMRYEDLVLRPEPTLHAALEFIGVPWDPAVLAHERVARLRESSVNHASADAVQRPLNSNAIGRYRQDLSEREVSAFWGEAEHTLRRHGYE